MVGKCHPMVLSARLTLRFLVYSICSFSTSPAHDRLRSHGDVCEVIRQSGSLAWRTLSVAALSSLIVDNLFRIPLFAPFSEVSRQFRANGSSLCRQYCFFCCYHSAFITVCRFHRLYRWILIGICIYSSLQVVNNQFLLLNKLSADSVFVCFRRVSFYFRWQFGLMQCGAGPRLRFKCLN